MGKSPIHNGQQVFKTGNRREILKWSEDFRYDKTCCRRLATVSQRLRADGNSQNEVFGVGERASAWTNEWACARSMFARLRAVPRPTLPSFMSTASRDSNQPRRYSPSPTRTVVCIATSGIGNRVMAKKKRTKSTPSAERSKSPRKKPRRSKKSARKQQEAQKQAASQAAQNCTASDLAKPNPKTETDTTQPIATTAQPTVVHADDCVVVGIGASAGGLEAFKRFLETMPHDSGMAFVLIQHLDPDHESMMAELLSKHQFSSLELPGSRITDIGLELITQQQQIFQLNLQGANISTEGWKLLSKIKKLNMLTAGGEKFANAELKEICNLKNLHTLVLHNSEVTPQGLASLSQLPKLQHLQFVNTPVTMDHLKHFKQLPSLKSLLLRNTELTEAHLAFLSEKCNLTYLDISGNELSVEAIESFKQQNPDCMVNTVDHPWFYD